jgi:DNA repair protein RadC
VSMLEKITTFARRGGVPEAKLKNAIDGISAILSLPTESGLASPYEGADAPEPTPQSEGTPPSVRRGASPSPPTPGSKRDRARNEAIVEWGRLGRALKTTDRISSIIPGLVSREIPAWSIDGSKIETPADFAAAVQTIRSPYFESLKVAFLDADLVVRHSQVLTVGTLNESIAHIRDFLQAFQTARAKAAERGLAGGVVVSHNHPSGDPSPSDADRQLQKRLESAMAVIGVRVRDHVITNGETCYSFAAQAVSKIDAYKAPWEVVERSRLIPVNSSADMKTVIRALRAGPDAGHIIYLNTKHRVTGVERLPLKVRETMDHWEGALAEGVAREGAAGMMFDLGECCMSEVRPFLDKRIAPLCRVLGVPLIDASTTGVASMYAVGLLEEAPEYTVAEDAEPAPEQEAPLPYRRRPGF